MKYLQFHKKIVKIGPVDPEIIGPKGIIKKKKTKEINASRTVSKHAERVELVKLVTIRGGRTDGRTHDDSIHRTSMASCGKRKKRLYRRK